MKKTTVKNYIRVIYEAGGVNELVRTSDIAKMLGYRPSSVTGIFQKLAQEGIIIYIPYRGVKFSTKGKKIAEKVIRRLDILRRFLLYIGIPQELAETECKNLELILSEKTMEYIDKYLKETEGNNSGINV